MRTTSDTAIAAIVVDIASYPIATRVDMFGVHRRLYGMSERHFREESQPLLTPEEQAEVIRLACRLQEGDRRGIPMRDFVRAAQEAGIEERFVQEAIRHLKSQAETPPSSVQPRSHAPEALSLIWGFLVWIVLASYGNRAETNLMWGASLLLAPVLVGLLAQRQRQALVLSLATALNAMMAVLTLIGRPTHMGFFDTAAILLIPMLLGFLAQSVRQRLSTRRPVRAAGAGPIP